VPLQGVDLLNNAFNYIAGIASIVSLILTLTPYFPTYKNHFRFAMVFFLGLLIGSLFATASTQTVVLQFEGTLTQTLLLGGAVASAVIALVVVTSIALGGELKDSHSAAGWSSAGLFLLFMVIYGISSWANVPKASVLPNYSARSVDELLTLARFYNQQGNKNLALEYFDKALEVTYREEVKQRIIQERERALDDKK